MMQNWKAPEDGNSKCGQESFVAKAGGKFVQTKGIGGPKVTCYIYLCSWIWACSVLINSLTSSSFSPFNTKVDWVIVGTKIWGSLRKGWREEVGFKAGLWSGSERSSTQRRTERECRRGICMRKCAHATGACLQLVKKDPHYGSSPTELSLRRWNSLFPAITASSTQHENALGKIHGKSNSGQGL